MQSTLSTKREEVMFDWNGFVIHAEVIVHRVGSLIEIARLSDWGIYSRPWWASAMENYQMN